jgi:magnesium-transporting ATPase (P-type)
MKTDTIIDNSDSAPKQSPVNIAFKWALIGLLISIIQTFTMYYINGQKYDPKAGGAIGMLIGIAVTFFILFMAMKEYRDKEQGGFITFGKAFKTGFLTSLFTILLAAVFTYVFLTVFIDYDTYLGEQMDNGIADMKKRGMSDEEIQKAMKSIPEFFSSKTFFLAVFVIWGLIFYTIISLITAAIVKRNPPQF